MIHIRLFAFATRLVWPSISSSFRYGRFASMWLVHKFKAERLGVLYSAAPLAVGDKPSTWSCFPERRAQ